MGTLRLADTDIFYEELGPEDAPVLVALHGGLGIDHAYLRPHWDNLAGRHRLVYMDARGNGRSGRPPVSTITMEQLACDIDALRDHLDVEQVGLIGHSYGGFIALETAVRFPASVAFLVLVDTSPGQLPGLVGPLDTTVPQITDDEFGAQLLAMLPNYFHDFDPKFAAALMDGTIINGQVAMWSMQVLMAWSVVEALPSISVPTLVVVGASDRICPPAASEIIATGIPGAVLESIDAAGHFPWLEQPAPYHGVVKAFVDAQAPRP